MLVPTPHNPKRAWLSATEQGAALLDQKSPGWYEHVDTKSLRVVDPKRCVLAQVFGCYGKGTVKVGIRGDEAYSYGFAGYGLDRKWIKEIKKRRKSDKEVT